MEKQRNKVCGADIHKKFIMATILSRDGNKIRGRFGMTLDEIMRFKEWVEKLVNNSTQMKNRIHKELESACIKISSVLTDIFGVSGMKIINGLLEGKNIDEILKMITSKRILKVKSRY